MVVVLPCVVKKSDSRIYRLLNQAYGQIARLHRPQMISAKADDRDLFPCLSERPARNLVSTAVRHLRRNCSRCHWAAQKRGRKHCPRGAQACLDEAPALDFGCQLGSLILSTLIYHCSSPRRLWCRLWHQPGAVRLVQHLRDLSLSVIEGKSMRHPGHRVVIPQRYLVWLEAAVGRRRSAASAQGLHLALSHRLKAAHDAQVLVQHVQRVHAANSGRDGETHRVTQHFLSLNNAGFYPPRGTTHALHAQRCHASPIDLG